MPDDVFADVIAEIEAAAAQEMARVQLSPETRAFIAAYIASLVPWMAVQSAIVGDEQIRGIMSKTLESMDEFVASVRRAHQALGQP